ncbi:MAG: fibronectin type III domain-containing protein [Roseburia sp.]|nr:fibronectin type III domain-containing protein [Roseburia sp.]
MKQRKRKFAGLIIMAVLTLGVLLVPAKVSKAVDGYKYGTFAVTALSSTEVTIDYRGELEDYSGATVYGFDIYAEDLTLETGEVLIKQAAANEVFGTLTGLTPGHTYQIIVRTHYQYYGSEDSYGYSFVQFETPLSGVSSEVDVVTDTGIAAPAPEPTQDPAASQSQVQTPAVVSVAAPSVTSVKMTGGNVAASVTPVVCDGYEFGIFNKSTNALVKTESTILNGAVFYGVGRKNIYIMRARAYAYDSAGNKVYSAWGAGRYFVPQPQIRKSASKCKKNSINLKWNKVSGAKNYTIYMRKRGSGKWYKVKTVSGKKASYKITKFRGKGFNTHRQSYEVKVKATAKIGGKTYSSTSNDYIYTYTYTRYR